MKTWAEAEEAFDDYLDNAYPEIEMMGMTFLPSEMLKNADRIAYECVLGDFIDSEGYDSDDFEN